MSKKRKTKKWIITGIIVIGIVAVAGSLISKPVPTSYESVKAQTGDITNYYSFSGNIESKNRQTVMSDNMMQISDIKVKEGEKVKEGDELIRTKSGQKIKAKIDGEIVNIKVEEDQQVMSGMELLEIVDFNNLQVSVKVDEYDLAAVEKGKETTVNIVALDKTVNGKISSISKEGQVENGITFFTATMDLKKDENLRIGMSTEVKLLNKKVSGVVTLPMTAILFDDQNKPYVLKEGEDGTPINSKITIGINDGMTIEITEGVSKGEIVLYPKDNETTNAGFMGGNPNQQGLGGGEVE